MGRELISKKCVKSGLRHYVVDVRMLLLRKLEGTNILHFQLKTYLFGLVVLFVYIYSPYYFVLYYLYFIVLFLYFYIDLC